jgi:hypothetical protein
MLKEVPQFDLSHVSGPGLNVDERIINYVLAYAAVHAQPNGKLVDVFVHGRSVVEATGASRGHVSRVLTEKLSHVMSFEGITEGWGYNAGTYPNLVKEAKTPPTPITDAEIKASVKSNIASLPSASRNYHRVHPRGTSPQIYDGTT